jgi:hypothetical protein
VAERGKPLDQQTERMIRRIAQVQSIRQTAKLAEVSRNTVRKVVRRAAG